MKDAVGVQINVGDDVVYAVANSSSVTLNRGTVLEIVTTGVGFVHKKPEVKARVEVFDSSCKWAQLPRNVLITSVNCLVV